MPNDFAPLRQMRKREDLQKSEAKSEKRKAKSEKRKAQSGVSSIVRVRVARLHGKETLAKLVRKSPKAAAQHSWMPGDMWLANWRVRTAGDRLVVVMWCGICTIYLLPAAGCLLPAACLNQCRLSIAFVICSDATEVILSGLFANLRVCHV